MTTDWFSKVQGLLAQAESTTFPGEAEAFMAKAQQLMSLHAIDEAMLRSRGMTRDDIVTEVVRLVNPYLNQKHLLLDQICKANGVRSIMTLKPKGSKGAEISLVGFPADIESVKTLFSSMSTYAVADMLKQRVPAYESARGFRVSYLAGFAARLGKRLKESAEAAKQEYADANNGASGMEIVLVEKSKEVDKAYREAFPNMRMKRTSSAMNSGYKARQSAADRANINRSVSGGAQRALGA